MSVRVIPIAARRPRSRQRGVVLFVAMIAVITLTLGALALDRAVTTDAKIAASLGARTQASLLGSEAIERAVAALFESGAIADRARDEPSQNYFASRQAAEDGRGVPRALQSTGGYPSGAAVIEAPDRHSVRYVIERLCVNPGPATIDNCTLSAPPIDPATRLPVLPAPPRTPGYRVTARIDGPAGSAVFVQALLGEPSERRRLSWRVLDE